MESTGRGGGGRSRSIMFANFPTLLPQQKSTSPDVSVHLDSARCSAPRVLHVVLAVAVDRRHRLPRIHSRVLTQTVDVKSVVALQPLHVPEGRQRVVPVRGPCMDRLLVDVRQERLRGDDDTCGKGASELKEGRLQGAGGGGGGGVNKQLRFLTMQSKRRFSKKL